MWVGGAPAKAGSGVQAERLADYAVAELGRVDVWVNNAGACQTTKGGLTDTDPVVMQAGTLSPIDQAASPMATN